MTTDNIDRHALSGNLKPSWLQLPDDNDFGVHRAWKWFAIGLLVLNILELIINS